jgi:hypothetical protein
MSTPHVVRVFGSPDKYYAHGPTGWVGENGEVASLPVLPDSAKQEFKGDDAVKKIALLGFGGKAFTKQDVKNTGSDVKTTGSDVKATGSEKPKTDK